MSQPIVIQISPGEYFDRLTILQIKSRRIHDPAKLVHVNEELAALTDAGRGVASDATIATIVQALLEVNEQLWQVEDDLRDLERQGRFDEGFVSLARSVYKLNDRRALLKRQINDHLGSDIVEEKSYAPYPGGADPRS